MGSSSDQQLRFTEWQNNALDVYFSGGDRKDFLAVVTPGGGKTRWAMAVAKGTGIPRVIVVCPTIYIKKQWVEEAALFDIKLGDMEDLHSGDVGVTTTYQAVESNPGLFAQMVASVPSCEVVEKEIKRRGDRQRAYRRYRYANDPEYRAVRLEGCSEQIGWQWT